MSIKDLKRVKISEIIENQIPEYFSDSNPFFVEFLKEYYNSQEFQGGPLDIINNLDNYVKHENLNKETLVSNTSLTSDITSFSETIGVESTDGWPSKYGLFKIDNEIITYTGITSTSFTGCIRGFSGVESLNEMNSPDTFVFLDTVASDHDSGTKVINLSNLFIQKFYQDLKYQYAPGLENVGINTNINPANLFTYLKNFYKSKGTEKSFRILFDVLFGVDISFIRPSDYLFTPSDSQWVVNSFIIAEDLTGDVKQLKKGVQLEQPAKVGFAGASGVVYYYTNIPEVQEKFYSKIGFDQSTLEGSFSNTAITILTEKVDIGDTVISVDSTVGFDTSGTIAIKNQTNTGLDYFTYSSKTLTQFLGCVGLGSTVGLGRTIQESTNLYEDNFLKGTVDGSELIFSITNVISGLNNENTRYLSVGDKINIKSFGYENNKDPIFTSWIYNIRNTYSVVSFQTVSSVRSQFVLNTYKNIFLSDTLSLYNKTTNSLITTATVADIKPNYIELDFSNTSILSSVSASDVFIRRNLNKSKSSIYQGLGDFVTETQNTYIDSDDYTDVYVSSSGLPSYEISSDDNSYTFTNADIDTVNYYITINNHNFYSGQIVKYEPIISNQVQIEPLDGLQEGNYYVKKIDSNRIGLCFNRKNVQTSTLIPILPIPLSANSHKISLYRLSDKNITSQNFLKIFPVKPIETKIKYEIVEGNTAVGMFVNGVEIIHSKSDHEINYGSITDIAVSSSSDTFEVTQAPKLTITDDNGSGAKGIVHLIGSVSEVIVDNPGFRFLESPRVEVIGGNGEGAILDVNLKLSDKEYSIEFVAEEKTIGINTTNDTIKFKTNHPFITGDRVIYETNGNTSPFIIRYDSYGVGVTTSLSESDFYYVESISPDEIKLHYNNNDSILGINTVNLYQGGSGVHKLILNEPVSVISSIVVSDGGINYQNREIKVNSTKYPPENYEDLDTILTGINTAYNYIFAKNHKFDTGDLVEYATTGSSIVGLATTSQYYVLKIDENKFRLCGTGSSITSVVSVGATGISTNVTTTFNTDLLNQGKYLKFSGIGTGTHTFKFPDIKVKIQALTGIGSTVIFSNVKCKGQIDSVFVYDGGVNYGSPEVFDYIKSPKIEVTTGSGAKISPVVSPTGSVVDFVIVKGGQDYVTEPIISVSGVGTGIQAKAILVDGVLTDIDIIDGGTGYDQSTTIASVVSIGKTTGVYFKPSIQKWTVDNFELHKKLYTTSDDGAIIESLNENYGNRYVNFGAPRKLRYKLSDNINDNFSENPTNHSPIIGWAYDGNPIYGPYGFDSPTDSSAIKKLSPGYTQVQKPNRPPSYPLGFFVEDNVFTNTGDLDENNGRYCITPDFPKGTYAYFTTISNNNGSGSYSNNKFPIYPYVIGKNFNNQIKEFNFEYTYNDILFNSKNTTLIKNLSPYNVDSYDFLDLKSSPRRDILEVKSIDKTDNKVDAISVISPGSNYRVGDLLEFDDKNTDGGGASALVFTVVGKGVTSITGVTSIFTDTKLTYNGTSIIGFTTIPHNFYDGDIIKISSVKSDDSDPSNDTTDSVYFKDLLKNHEVSVSISTCGITTSIPSFTGAPSSGFTTFISLKERTTINKLFKVNDIVGINSEYMLVLNVDDINNRIRVLRGYNPSNPSSRASSGVAYTSGEIVEEKPTEFKIDLPNIRSNKSVVDTRLFYFDPEETVGLGTTGSVVTYNVGIGSTTNNASRIINKQSIYIPNHKLITGDKLLYSPNTGTALSVSKFEDLSSPVALGNTVYAINKGNDFIGLSTTRVGLGSTSNTGLYFTNYGSGEDHQLTTDFGENLISTISKEYVVVGTSETHGMSNNDIVILNVESRKTDTYKVLYHDKNRRVTVGFGSTNSSFVTTGITGSAFTIQNHGLTNGSKVIYNADNPASPLENKSEYYVIKVNDDVIRLASNKYDAEFSYSFVELSSSGSGIHTFHYINPQIKAIKGSTIKFDVSDSSMSDFNIEFFTDSRFQNKFVGTGTFFGSGAFETKYSGNPGSSNSFVEVYTKFEIPEKLFYNFKLSDINLQSNSTKLGFEIDDEVPNYSNITLYESKYNAIGQIYDADYNQYEFKLDMVPSDIKETSVYVSSGVSSDSVINYTTTSTSTTGPVSVVRLVTPGVGYLSIPSVEDIISEDGDGGQFIAVSKSIGKVNKTEIYKPSFAIPSDFTIKPILDLPYSIKVKNHFTFKRIKVVDPGKNYTTPPKIIAIDSDTGVEIPKLGFTAVMSNKSVQSIRVDLNRTDLTRDVTIIAINNSNGYPIIGATYDDITQLVTLSLNPSTSSSVMSSFAIGDKIFVEGIVSSSPTSEFNSKSNKYETFTITNVDAINKTIEYVLKSGNPGSYDSLNSSGYLIKENDLAQFLPVYSRGIFKNDEDVTITKLSGLKKTFRITSNNGWNGQILKITDKNPTSQFEIEPGDLIEGKISKQVGTVEYVRQSSSEALVDSFYVEPIGWEKENGKLSVSEQRIQDSDYYQKFSYDIKSTISTTQWKEIVDSLNHPSGTKSFGSIIIVSEPSQS